MPASCSTIRFWSPLFFPNFSHPLFHLWCVHVSAASRFVNKHPRFFANVRRSFGDVFRGKHVIERFVQRVTVGVLAQRGKHTYSSSLASADCPESRFIVDLCLAGVRYCEDVRLAFIIESMN